jgi:hypothetical protein
MNTERRLALLEAFAKSKSYEFQGFRVRWLEQHPEPEEPEVVAEPVVAEEKPKRKRKTKVEEPVVEAETEDAGA